MPLQCCAPVLPHEVNGKAILHASLPFRSACNFGAPSALKNIEPWVDEHSRKVFMFRVVYQQLAALVRRFYYLADRLGMLVWQDMPSMCGMWEMPGATGEWYFDGCWVTNTCASPALSNLMSMTARQTILMSGFFDCICRHEVQLSSGQFCWPCSEACIVACDVTDPLPPL